MFPLEFRGEVDHEETRVMGPDDCSNVVPACDRRADRWTDGRTDGRIYYS